MSKKKPFLVSKVVAPELEGGKVEWIDLEAFIVAAHNEIPVVITCGK